ncbi:MULTISPECIES: hypothetical protein [unclassified Pseudoalteromonas]|uniref:hypothetical protein n=1 Tax=unclassified Pseudoalteromonas TaxID=194690 RepID=UPI003014221D
MDKNFTVGQSNELVVNDIFYDLHNVYQLKDLTFDGNELRILFELDGKELELPKQLVLVFDGVTFLQFSDEINPKRFWAVEEMGYKSFDDFDDDWLATEQQSEFKDHLFIRLVGNGFIRVYSKHAKLVEL